VIALLLTYKYGRFLVSGQTEVADRNAHRVIGFERTLGMFTEARLQDLVVSSATFVRFLNAYYLAAHVVVTAFAFLWLYARHPEEYRRFRNVMIAITIAGMCVHLLFPLAPPRMFPKLGFVDTARVFGPASYGAGSPYKGFANQLAAMPSLHFGWALVIAWAALLALRSRWRYLVLAHPVLTLAAIVLTANHYWLDAVVATILLGGSLVVDQRIEQRRQRRRRLRPGERSVQPRSSASCAATTASMASRRRSPTSPSVSVRSDARSRNAKARL
jgi:PAP2 superfamily